MSMIKIEELRIGDWVKIKDIYYPNPIQIGGIIPKHETLFVYFEEIGFLVPCEKLQAIPLTEDLLGENGFYPSMEDERIYEYCYGGHYVVSVQKDGEFINLIDETGSHDDEDYDCDLIAMISATWGDRLAVHNLQHFLTENGIDIKIKV